HRDAADSVIERAGCRVPRIKMAAKHYDFIFEFRICSRDLSDHIISRPARPRIRLQAELEFYGHVSLSQTYDPRILLTRHYERGNILSRIETIEALNGKDSI